jgi:GNAT superfamily N-acetyltransferase
MKTEVDYKKCLGSEVGETERLIIKNSVMDECEKLQLINEASDYIEKWVGWKTPSDYAFITLTEGNLPPGGEKEYFKAKTIYLKQTNEIIGVLELYYGYPSKEVLCIGWLFILPLYQKMGYAQEVINYIFWEAKKENFSKIQLGVHLKNWPAIRFWHKVGFDKIIAIDGDDVHSENTFASIILQRNLE